MSFINCQYCLDVDLSIQSTEDNKVLQSEGSKTYVIHVRFVRVGIGAAISSRVR